MLIGKTDGPTSVAASLATLLFGFVLPALLSLVGAGAGPTGAAAPAPAPVQGT